MDAIDLGPFGWVSMSGRARGGGRGGGWGGGPAWGFPGFGPPRPPRARRGDVRAALLLLLDEEPRNGYQLMQEIEQRSAGVWRPSPGSVYPALQQLADEGLVEATGDDRKVYGLTDAGREYVIEQRERLGAPWDAVKGDVGDGAWELIGAMKPIGAALFQIMHSGTEEQQREARATLDETRRALYRILGT